MIYSINVTGSPHRRDIPSRIAQDINSAVSTAIITLLDIYDIDHLQRTEVARAIEFWTPEEILGDLQTARQCDIVLCGGYYCVEIRECTS